MRRYFLSIIIILFVLVLSAVGCGEPKTPLPTDLQSVVITLERTACYGYCPVYKLVIYGDGRVIYEGTKYVETLGTKMGSISEEKVKQMIYEFRKINYFSLKDSYQHLDATDMPGVITSLTIDGQKKTVNHYHGDFNAPKSLTNLENKIDQIVSSDQWVGSFYE
jgi:(2Fe-2S) ferredoxin